MSLSFNPNTYVRRKSCFHCYFQGPLKFPRSQSDFFPVQKQKEFSSTNNFNIGSGTLNVIKMILLMATNEFIILVLSGSTGKLQSCGFNFSFNYNQKEQVFNLNDGIRRCTKNADLHEMYMENTVTQVCKVQKVCSPICIVRLSTVLGRHVVLTKSKQ